MVLTLAIIATVGLVLSLVFAAVRDFGDLEEFILYFILGLIATALSTLVLAMLLSLWLTGLGIDV